MSHYVLRMTVTVRLRGEKQMLVHANAQYKLYSVVEPEPYQKLFASIEKAMFLTAHQLVVKFEISSIRQYQVM